MSDDLIGNEPSDDIDSIQLPSQYPNILGTLGEFSAAAAALPAPRSVYMIYMKIDHSGKLIVKHHWELDYQDSLEAAETRLYNAASDTQILGQGTNFENIVWRRPYYLTFVMDNTDWRFHWGADDEDEPIRFLRYKAGSGDIHITNKYSFSQARRVQNLGSGDAFRITNYHVNSAGMAIGNEPPQKYCFQVYLQSPFAIPGNPHSHIVLIVDPDGQNQGPRV